MVGEAEGGNPRVEGGDPWVPRGVTQKGEGVGALCGPPPFVKAGQLSPETARWRYTITRTSAKNKRSVCLGRRREA